MAFFDMGTDEYKHSVRSKILETVDIPKDVSAGVSLITVIGKTELIIENYIGLIEYTECLIRMKTKHSQIKIEGKALHIEYYAAEEMKVTGRICCISFL